MPRSLPALPAGGRSRPWRRRRQCPSGRSGGFRAYETHRSELEVDAGCTTVLITILDSSNRHPLGLIPFAPHQRDQRTDHQNDEQRDADHDGDCGPVAMYASVPRRIQADVPTEGVGPAPKQDDGRRLRRCAVTRTEWGRVVMFRGPARGYPANLDVGHTGRSRKVGASGS